MLIKEDLGTACGVHNSLLNYYILNDELEIRKNMNNAFSRQVSAISPFLI